MTAPKFPPMCPRCGRELVRAEMKSVGFDPCPRHPNAPPIYRTQEPQDGYPAGWHLCRAGCGRPALDGKRTCGQVNCHEAPRRS